MSRNPKGALQELQACINEFVNCCEDNAGISQEPVTKVVEAIDKWMLSSSAASMQLILKCGSHEPYSQIEVSDLKALQTRTRTLNDLVKAYLSWEKKRAELCGPVPGLDQIPISLRKFQSRNIIPPHRNEDRIRFQN